MATLDTVATRPEGNSIADGKAYFETSTNQFIVWDATDDEWIQLDSDGTGSYAFNIDIRDTESNILGMAPTEADADNAVVAYATDTHDFYIYDGSAWYIYSNDSSDPIFDGQLTFPDIQVFDNESDFISDTGAPDYTIVHAKDTDKLYVWDGTGWYIYNSDFNSYSLDFDGTDDYVSITQDSAINISGDITLSAWIKRTSTSSYNAIFTKRQVGGSMNYQFTINNSNGQIGLGHSGGSWVYNTTTTLATDVWYHVAVTVSSGTAQFYVNGVSEDSFTGVSVTATTQDLIIGATVGYNYFGGNIDEAAIFNSALSASNISSIYNSGVPADISSLNPIGWWRMGDNNGGTGTTITDQGSGGNDGTLTNGPTFSTTVPS